MNLQQYREDVREEFLRDVWQVSDEQVKATFPPEIAYAFLHGRGKIVDFLDQVITKTLEVAERKVTKVSEENKDPLRGKSNEYKAGYMLRDRQIEARFAELKKKNHD